MAKFEIVGYHHIFEIPPHDEYTEKWFFGHLYKVEQFNIQGMKVSVYDENLEIFISSESIDEQLVESERQRIMLKIKDQWKIWFEKDLEEIHCHGFYIYRKVD